MLYVIRKGTKRVWLENHGGDSWGEVRSVRDARRFSRRDAVRFAEAYGPKWIIELATPHHPLL